MRHKRLQACIEKHPALETCATDIELAGELLKQTFEEGGKLLLCGNGGSAADSDHIAGELLKGFDSKRHLATEWREKLGDSLADNLQTGLPVIPLTGFNALSTAYANDCDGQYTFAQLAFALGQSGDALMGISTSGNSANVLHALKTARAMEMSTIGLTGESGGQLTGLVDCCIRVPSSVVWEIQELHLPVYHTLCLMLEDHFFSEAD
jgi:D-sedoheptulose 7-phosphate isomerase